ncbi:hypothetical protein BJ875DRAFT_530741 [Amylocarpus encephaloides]|uniref:Zn(2)-C6 fungal-type domain-containing protein n=1 Tax=Amylocarpus encephaloides TaxID=45428 RepID=A0A9P8C602_9HELO|nr:hypothetical protein BJ875DRAFT_530741 [Amylocarpus encephaloides]
MAYCNHIACNQSERPTKIIFAYLCPPPQIAISPTDKRFQASTSALPTSVPVFDLQRNVPLGKMSAERIDDHYRKSGGTWGRNPRRHRRVTESCAPCRKIGQACPQYTQGYIHRLTPCGRCLMNGKECSFSPHRVRPGLAAANQPINGRMIAPEGANMCRILDGQFQLIVAIRIRGRAEINGIVPTHSVHFYYDPNVAEIPELDGQPADGKSKEVAADDGGNGMGGYPAVSSFEDPEGDRLTDSGANIIPPRGY